MLIELLKYKHANHPYPVVDILAVATCKQELSTLFGVENIGVEIIQTQEGRLFIPDGAYARSEIAQLLEGKNLSKYLERNRVVNEYIRFLTDPNTSFKHCVPETKEMGHQAVLAAIMNASQLEDMAYRAGVTNDYEIVLPPTVAILEPGMNMTRTHEFMEGRFFKASSWFPPTYEQMMGRYKDKIMSVNVALIPPHFGTIEEERKAFYFTSRYTLD